MYAFLPVALALAGALLFYLGSPRQQWLRAPLWPRYSRAAAALLIVCALFANVGAQPFATSLSIVLTASMTGLVACPFIGVLIGVLLGRLRIAPPRADRCDTVRDTSADTSGNTTRKPAPDGASR